MNAIFKRKSIRQFLDKQVENEKIERILKAGMQAPSAHNSQPWEFIVVKNKEGIDKIANMSKYSGPAKNSPLCIITLINKKFADAKGTSKWLQQDMSACSENILLQAVEEGLGAVWLGTYPENDRVEILKEYFKVPDYLIPFSVIVIGYPKKDYQAEDRFDKIRIHNEFY